MTAFAVDTSALVCVLNDEPEAMAFNHAFHEADEIFISTATVLEASCVMAGDRFVQGRQRLRRLMELLSPTIVPFDAEQLTISQTAYAKFGRGSAHPASLNMGDCFAYSLAKTLGIPLLFKGDDFIHTDIQPALKP